MRACANGKQEIATILYHWNSSAAKLRNKAGESCAELAGRSPCPAIRIQLERLEQQRTEQSGGGRAALLPPRAPSLAAPRRNRRSPSPHRAADLLLLPEY